MNSGSPGQTSGLAGVDAIRVDAGVTVRYWASARAAAGCDSERFSGRHVAEVLDAAAAAHPGLGPVLEVCTILLDGHPVTASQSLSDNTTLEVLPPFAGG